MLSVQVVERGGGNRQPLLGTRLGLLCRLCQLLGLAELTFQPRQRVVRLPLVLRFLSKPDEPVLGLLQAVPALSCGALRSGQRLRLPVGIRLQLLERALVADDRRLVPGKRLIGLDKVLLLLDRQGVPRRHVVQVLLHDDVAAAGEGRVFGADERRVLGDRAGRVLGAVHETEQVALVEVLEAVRLVHRGHDVADAAHDLRGELEAQVHVGGADVEQQVAGRGHRVVHALDLAEGVQVGRPRRAEQPVPRVGAEAAYARQVA